MFLSSTGWEVKYIVKRKICPSILITAESDHCVLLPQLILSLSNYRSRYVKGHTSSLSPQTNRTSAEQTQWRLLPKSLKLILYLLCCAKPPVSQFMHWTLLIIIQHSDCRTHTSPHQFFTQELIQIEFLENHLDQPCAT